MIERKTINMSQGTVHMKVKTTPVFRHYILLAITRIFGFIVHILNEEHQK